jgi:hypothetical protein
VEEEKKKMEKCVREKGVLTPRVRRENEFEPRRKSKTTKNETHNHHK